VVAPAMSSLSCHFTWQIRRHLRAGLFTPLSDANAFFLFGYSATSHCVHHKWLYRRVAYQVNLHETENIFFRNVVEVSSGYKLTHFQNLGFFIPKIILFVMFSEVC
jgi:hypothetical protein